MKKAKTRAQRRRVAMLRKVLLTLTLVMVVAMVTVGGTVAWLADKTDSIVNTFTVGDINIELDETENLDLKMIPGNTIAKDPKVTVEANSEAAYVFVKIDESSNYSRYLEDYVMFNNTDYPWKKLDSASSELSAVYYAEIPATTAEIKLQVLAAKGGYADGYVVVKQDVTKMDMNALTETTRPTLTFTAYAVQKDNLTVEQAWAQTQNPSNFPATTNP